MNEKTKKILIVSSIFLIGLLLSIFGKRLFAMAGVGVTVMSISDAKIVSSVPELNYQDAYLIDVVVNKGGEKIVGSFSPEDFKALGLREIPTGPFTMEIYLLNMSCEYDIVEDQIQSGNEMQPFVLYKIYQAPIRYSLAYGRCNYDLSKPCPYDKVNLDTVKKFCKGQIRPGCGARTANGIHYPECCNKAYLVGGAKPVVGPAPEGGDCDAMVDIQATPQNKQGNADASEWCYAMPKEISFDNVHWEVTHIGGVPFYIGYKIGTTAKLNYAIKVKLNNANGTIVETTLTNEEATKFLDSIGRVKLVGGLIANQFCKIPAVDYSVVKDVTNNKIKLVDKRDYDNYRQNLIELVNFDNNYYVFVRTDPGVGREALQLLQSNLNTWLRHVHDTNITPESIGCRFEGLKLVCEPETDVIYPELQLLIRADWIGVYIPSGIPKIEDVKIPDTIYEGEIANAEVTIKNLANESDSFDVFIDCPKPVMLNPVRESFKANEEKTLKLNILGGKGEQECTVKAVSVNNPANYDEYNTTIKIIERPLPEGVKPKEVKPTVVKKVPSSVWVIIGILIGVLVLGGLGVVLYLRRIGKI